MSRKYSSWALNQPSIHPELTNMMRLTTVAGNEQDQLKNFERVEAIPHMYINVDAPPPPTTKFDARAMQPTMMQNHNSSFFAAPTALPPPSNLQTKIWPIEKPSRNPSAFDSGSTTTKRAHKHKHHHHHHHHHADKHHHHRHHSRRHRAKSAESIRNRQHRTSLSSSKIMLANPQYIEQDQQQQQQPMIVYRELSNGDGYTVDQNGFASVPYMTENEQGIVDDQQAPVVVYRDTNLQQTQHQSLMSDGISQDVFYNTDQDGTISKQNIPLQPIVNKLISPRVAPVNETQVNSYARCICNQMPTSMNTNINYIQEIERIYIEEDYSSPLSIVNPNSDNCVFQQSDPFISYPQQQHQQSSQIVYCTDPNQQDYLCTSNNHNSIIQQSISPQQQYVCVDNTQQAMQPTIINQIPVFNPLATNTNSQSLVNVPQQSLQRTTSVVIQQPQSQPLQIFQQPQPLQVIQQPQPLQVIQQPQQLQVIQQPQQLQFISNQQTQPGQFLQITPATQQMIQTIQPQVIQAPSVLQTIQMPAQAIAASPQILYQRPYDPVVGQIQNQQVTIANSPLVALSQPSYAPARIAPVVSGVQSQGPNMFRHALLQTVAGRTGVPLPSAVAPSGGGGGAIQLMQPTAGAANQNFILAGNPQRSGSVPIVPLTPGGLLIPFQPSQTSGGGGGLGLRRPGANPSNIRNFNDIRQHIQEQRAQILQNLQQQQQRYNRIPSPPVLSAGPRNQGGAYLAGNSISGGSAANSILGGSPPNSIIGGSAGQNGPYLFRNGYSAGARSGRTPFPSGAPSTYARPPSVGLNYSQPSYQGSYAGSIR
ncbi:unnamed protein product [Adineta steineri]|uniref:Uncharacterized protein n=1 Tax=Adineta steineri TaxID=433720 RepID=A0A819CQ23_9BILA|nr:unnamed protein product [Adineta steineri]